ncbi:hypothetical protein D3C72_1785540 [compost metagenome]
MMLRREYAWVRLSKVSAACIFSACRVWMSSSSARNSAGTVTDPQTMKNRPQRDGCSKDMGGSSPVP